MKRALVVSITVFALLSSLASAEIIRDGIDIEFVTIGNAGNAADTGGTVGCGAVGYNYRIGKYEVTNAQWNAFTAVAGAPKGNLPDAYNESAHWTGAQQPTNEVSWYEAAQFCNYLTSGDKSRGAYQFSGNNTNPGSFMGVNRDAAKTAYGTVYVLPTEDEWYKAAYFKPDASGYSFYANGQNTIPAADNGWNYYGGAYSSPWAVGTGNQEQNGTKDMMGNVWEWNETLLDGSFCGIRGGSYYDDGLASVLWGNAYPDYGFITVGFRVASIVPEPASLALLGLGGLALRYRKR